MESVLADVTDTDKVSDTNDGGPDLSCRVSDVSWKRDVRGGGLDPGTMC